MSMQILHDAVLRNWLPTIGGVAAAVGGVLSKEGPNDTAQLVGMCLFAGGTVLLGASARQWNVTSASQRKPPRPPALRPPIKK